MRESTNRYFCLCHLLLPIVLLLSLLGTADVAAQDGNKELVEYNPIMEVGDTRARLMNVSRITRFVQASKGAKKGEWVAVTGLEVAVRVSPLDRDVTKRHTGGVRVFQNDQEVQDLARTGPSQFAVSQVSSRQDDTMEEKEMARLSFDYTCFLNGVELEDGQCDLVVAVGFGELEEFRFQDVPIR